MIARRTLTLRAFSVWLLATSISSAAGKPSFVGPETCRLCHKDIAAWQEQSAMANTWQGSLGSSLPASLKAEVNDDLRYQLARTGNSLTYSVELGEKRTIKLPVSVTMGGRRHGVGFLVPLSELDGTPLERPVLLQGRYEWSHDKGVLLLAPGCSPNKPQSLEAALGLVLSPTFESKCLSCHGQPNAEGSGSKGGVHCEACHGPGSDHLAAIASRRADRGIINPKRFTPEQSIEVCARCHVGLTKFSDPTPKDLLIANQVRSIKSSECFLQSGKAFSCVTCHDPHNDAASGTRAINACLGCHSDRASPRAAICPVNRVSGCTGCHMPAVEMGALHLVDHQIRVDPNHLQGQKSQQQAELKTHIQPVSEYLRMMALGSSHAADAARDRLNAGETFYAVARTVSVDPSGAIGGYLGRKTLTELDLNVRNIVGKLGYGETSQILPAGGRWIIFQRLPRDFRWEAESLQDQAEALAARGDVERAIRQAQEALKIYPQLLRSLSFIGVTYIQNGNAMKGAEVMRVAAKLYPEDAAVEFALAASLNLAGDDLAAIDAYKRAIATEPDLIAAYVNLGLISFRSGDWQSSIRTFRNGLQIDPLSAELSYDLGLALLRPGQITAAHQALDLARKLDPFLVEQREAKLK